MSAIHSNSFKEPLKSSDNNSTDFLVKQKQTLIDTINKKLDDEIRKDNFLNGIHNSIANFINKQRKVTLNNLKTKLEGNNSITIAIDELPKKVKKQYQQFLTISSKNDLRINTSQPNKTKKAKPKKSLPQITFAKEFGGAKTKVEKHDKVDFKELWDNRCTQPLGKGSYGTVYTSKDDQYVFKVIKNKEAYAEDLKGNKVLFEGIKQQEGKQAFYDQGIGFVTQFCGELKTKEGERVLVFERAPGMEFAKYLQTPKLASKNVNDKLYTHCALLGEAATAIAIAHEAGCVNRDIKPGNIMIGQQQEQDGQITAVAKLIDQGLIYDLKKPSDEKIDICGTPLYLAPEMINESVYDKGISPAADVFSMGVMLMEVLLPELGLVVNNFRNEGAKIFNPDNPRKVVQDFNRKNFAENLKKPNYLTNLRSVLKERGIVLTPYTDKQLQFLGNLLKDCLAQKPEDRPSAAQVGELIQIFSASLGDAENLMPYETAKKLAEEDRPKAIPIAIRNMIADPKNYHAGLKALDELVKADPSYIKTPSYGLAMLYKDKYSKSGKLGNFLRGKTNYEKWTEENPTAASTLKDRVYIEGGKPTEIKNIPVTQEFHTKIIN